MMKWTTIGDVFKITSGGTPLTSRNDYYDGGDIPWVNTADLKQKELTFDKISKKVTKLGLENSSAKVFPANTVLVALYGATIGNCAILRTEAATNQACAALLPNEDQLPEFLYYYLVSIQSQLIKKGQGGGQPNISAEILKRTKYPIIDKETQQQIVAVLDKAHSIIDKRKTSLKLLDKLLQDTFLDMFGDPVNNPKGWKKEKLELYIDFLTSGSRGWAQHYVDTPGSIFLRIQNVGYNEMLINDLAYVDAPKSQEANRTKVQPRDVLVSITADLGRSCVVPELKHDAYINQHLCVIRLNNQLNPHFLSAQFASEGGKHQFVGLDKGGVKAGLNFYDIKNFHLIAPPIELQNKYEAIRRDITIIKSGLSKSLSHSETLFQSLLQKAFSEEGLVINAPELAIQNKISDIKDVKIILDEIPVDILSKKDQAKVEQLSGNLNTLLDTIKPFKNEGDLNKTLDKLNLGALKEYITPTPGSNFINAGMGSTSLAGGGSGQVGGLGTGTFYTIETKAPETPALEVNENFLHLLKDMKLDKLTEQLEQFKTEIPAAPEPKEETGKEETPKEETKPAEDIQTKEQPKAETKPTEEKTKEHKPKATDWKEEIAKITGSLPVEAVLSFEDFAKQATDAANFPANDPFVYTGMKDEVFDQLRSGKLKQVYGPDKETVAKWGGSNNEYVGEGQIFFISVMDTDK